MTSHVFDAEGTQHVFYIAGYEQNIVKLWWKGSGGVQPEDLTDRSGGAPLADDFRGEPISHVVKAERTQHVFYASLLETGAHQVIELWSEQGATFSHVIWAHRSMQPLADI